MRVVSLLLVAGLLAGCVAESAPSVSVSYSRQVQNGVETVTATLTSVEGIEDWSELIVEGCRAPEQGPIETPHRFQGCSGDVTIEHEPSGAMLYSSRLPHQERT